MIEIELSDSNVELIEVLIARGDYPTKQAAIDGVFNAYREMKEREYIAKALQEAEASGTSPRTPQEIWEEVKKELMDDDSIQP